VHRRDLILSGVSLPLLSLGAALEAFPAPRGAVPAGADAAFDADTVPALARALAARAYRAPDDALPPALARVGYDAYRDFRYRAARALWAGEGLPFQAQFFHRGFLFKDRVDVFTVRDGRATPFAFSTDLFDYTPQPVPDVGDVGFAGFRLHAPINRDDHYDEVCSFLGASY